MKLTALRIQSVALATVALLLTLSRPAYAVHFVFAQKEIRPGLTLHPESVRTVIYQSGMVYREVRSLETNELVMTPVAQISGVRMAWLRQAASLAPDSELLDQEPEAPFCADAPGVSYQLLTRPDSPETDPLTEIALHQSCHHYLRSGPSVFDLVSRMLDLFDELGSQR